LGKASERQKPVVLLQDGRLEEQEKTVTRVRNARARGARERGQWIGEGTVVWETRNGPGSAPSKGLCSLVGQFFSVTHSAAAQPVRGWKQKGKI